MATGASGIPPTALAGIKGSIIGATTHIFQPDILNEFNPSVELNVAFGGVHVPIGTELDPDVTKTAPDVTITSGGDSAKGYSLIIFDPDAPSPDNPSKRSWLHWITCNAKPDNLKAGNVVMEYAPPTPPKGTHRYVLLVCEQAGKSVALPKPADRGCFNVNKFVADNGLTPVGMSFFRVSAT